MPSSKIRVIGIGSPHAADQIGWQLVEHLKPAFPDLDWRTCQHPATDLIHLFANAETVILIDALHNSQPLGHAQLIDPEQLTQTANQASSHGLSVAEAIALAGALKLLPAKLRIIGISVGQKTNRTSYFRNAICNSKNLIEKILLSSIIRE